MSTSAQREGMHEFLKNPRGGERSGGVIEGVGDSDNLRETVMVEVDGRRE